MIDTCKLATLDLSVLEASLFSSPIQYEIKDPPLFLYFNSTLVDNSVTNVPCPPVAFEITNEDGTEIAEHYVFNFDNSTNEMKTETQLTVAVDTYTFKLKAYSVDNTISYYDFVASELLFDISVIDSCALAQFDLSQM